MCCIGILDSLAVSMLRFRGRVFGVEYLYIGEIIVKGILVALYNSRLVASIVFLFTNEIVQDSEDVRRELVATTAIKPGHTLGRLGLRRATGQ
jgi:uncharacterized membrane protein